MSDDTEESDGSGDEGERTIVERIPHQQRATTAGGILGAFGILLLLRVNAYPLVFRDEFVVSPLNDPYFYRYWMNELLAISDGGFDVSVLSEVGSTRPGTHASNWILAEWLGGTTGAADLVTAWLPVLGALGLGALLFGITYLLTRDIRVSSAAVVMLATIPIHAVNTGLGFVEHRLHQYFWLGVIMFGLVWFTVDIRNDNGEPTRTAVNDHLRRPRTWGIAAVTGVAIGISAHLWGGSPLVIAPLAGYVLLRTPMDLRAGLSPLRVNAPLVAALGLGSLLAYGLHTRFEWHESFAALTPSFVFVVAVSLLLLGEGWRRASLPAGGLLPVEAVVAGVSVWGLTRTFPEAVEDFRDRSEDLFGREGVAEVTSLFDPNFLVGPMFRMGVVFYFAVPVLMWATVVIIYRYEPGWLAMVLFGWYWVGLAAIQNRFAGQLSMFVAFFGAVGLVYGLHRLGVARPIARLPRIGVFELPRGESQQEVQPETDGGQTSETDPPQSSEPDDEQSSETDDGQSTETDESQAVDQESTQEDITTFGRPKSRRGVLKLGGAVAGFGLISAILVDEQAARAAYDDSEYNAMRAIVDHSERTGREYPANYVLSRWGTNRMYNYFTNGESERYSRAQREYPDFLVTETPDEWARGDQDSLGYVVIEDGDGDLPPGTAKHMLMDRLGVAMEYRNPLQQYQLIYLAGDGDEPEDWELAAFAVVPGARITGSAEPGETVTASTGVAAGGLTFPYATNTTVNEDGEFEIVVPYAGTYELQGETVEVTEQNVVDGDTVPLSEPGN